MNEFMYASSITCPVCYMDLFTTPDYSLYSCANQCFSGRRTLKQLLKMSVEEINKKLDKFDELDQKVQNFADKHLSDITQAQLEVINHIIQ